MTLLDTSLGTGSPLLDEFTYPQYDTAVDWEPLQIYAQARAHITRRTQTYRHRTSSHSSPHLSAHSLLSDEKRACSCGDAATHTHAASSRRRVVRLRADHGALRLRPLARLPAADDAPRMVGQRELNEGA